MRLIDTLRLIALAAIWGSSFLFMRILAPVLGALWTAEFRVGIATLTMLLCIAFSQNSLDLRQNYRHYLIVGTLNSALPFALFSYAAKTLPSGYSAIINATTPLWGAVLGTFFLSERLSVRKAIGLCIGVLGVALLVRLGPVTFDAQVGIAALACAMAALLYAVAGIYTKKNLTGIPAQKLATGSLLAAAIVLMPTIPFVPLAPLSILFTPRIIGCILGLALLCSALAYLLYFRLLNDLGPTRATTVTFLIPLFALTWGIVFLNEAINMQTIAGCAMVIVATALVLIPAKPKLARPE